MGKRKKPQCNLELEQMKEQTRADSDSKPIGTNHPEWYAVRGLPDLYGVNFDTFTTAGTRPFGVDELGIRINSFVTYATVLAPPIDQYNTLSEVFQHYFTVLQGINRSPSYRKEDIFCYQMNLITLRVLCHVYERMQRSIYTTNILNDDSSWLFPALAGIREVSRDEATDVLSAKLNAYIADSYQICSEYPMIPMTLYDREKWLYSNIFIEENNPKGAMVSFVPYNWFIYSVTRNTDANGQEYGEPTGVTAQPQRIESNPTGVLTAIRRLKLTIDTAYGNGRLRSDMLKAYTGAGETNSALIYDLGKNLMAAIPIVHDSKVNDQIENANIMVRQDSSVAVEFAMGSGLTEPKLQLGISGVIDSPIRVKSDLPKQLINWHGSSDPTGLEFLSITRLMPTGEHVNRIDKSYWDVTSSSGSIIRDMLRITGLGDDALPEYMDVSTYLERAQDGNYDAVLRVMNTFSLMDHTPMMLVSLNSEYGVLWDIDNYSYTSELQLQDYTRVANMALLQTKVPMKPNVISVRTS